MSGFNAADLINLQFNSTSALLSLGTLTVWTTNQVKLLINNQL
jgi:hypothetical protein